MTDLDPDGPTATTDDPTTAVPTPRRRSPPTPVEPRRRSRRRVRRDARRRPDAAAIYENDVAWATAVPVSSAPAPRWPLRWAAAIAIVAVILGASAAVAALVTNSHAQSTVIGYVPSSSIAYGEVRLDLPGDQRQAVGAFLSKFPGFHDQAALDTKLDEILDQFIKKATNDKQTYTADIKPWFGGEVALTVGPLPTGRFDERPGDGDERAPRARAAVRDRPGRCRCLDRQAFAASGAKTTTETYNGV